MVLLYTARVLYQIALGFSHPPKVNKLKKAVDVAFRCYPVDIDTYWHMNNANYLRVAELARWRIFPVSGLMKASLSKGWMFLAVEQNVTYLRPIKPFQRYIVSTKMEYRDNKWLLYEHSFMQHPDDVKPGAEAMTYSVVKLKAVLKERSGKTVRPETLLDSSPWNRNILSPAEGPSASL